MESALGAGSDRFTQDDIQRVTSTQKALRLKPAEVQVTLYPAGINVHSLALLVGV